MTIVPAGTSYSRLMALTVTHQWLVVMLLVSFAVALCPSQGLPKQQEEVVGASKVSSSSSFARQYMVAKQLREQLQQQAAAQHSDGCNKAGGSQACDKSPTAPATNRPAETEKSQSTG